MASQKNSISGIEIRPGQITIAQYFPQENSVGSVIIKPLSAASEVELDQALKNEFKDLVAEIDFKNQNVALALPSEYAIIKKLSLDSNEADVSGALKWELSQHLIGSLEEYSFDYEALADATRPAIKHYLVVAYRSASVQKLITLLKSTKLNPVIVGLDIFGLINAFEVNYREQTGLPSVLVLGTDEKSIIAVSQNNSLVDFEIFQHGPAVAPSDYGAKVAEYTNRMCLRLSLQSLPNAFCAGPLFSQTEYSDSLVEKLGNAELFDPFRTISCRAGKGEDELRKFSHQLAVAVGMALQGAMEI